MPNDVAHLAQLGVSFSAGREGAGVAMVIFFLFFFFPHFSFFFYFWICKHVFFALGGKKNEGK
jgi:hypothetical protein